MSEGLNQEYISLRQAALQKYFSGMNEMQKRAVLTIDGPLLILAGAGSGKTTVLINRIENMIRFGSASSSKRVPQGIKAEDVAALRDYVESGKLTPDELASIIHENPIKPWNILAITFTNKAAGELKARLSAKLGEAGGEVHASTFHSLCSRILRRDIDKIGYSSNFTIYDTDDSLRVIKEACGDLNIDEKVLAARVILTAISRAKDTLMTPQQLFEAKKDDFRAESIARVYDIYQKRLKSSNALDFDDMIVLAVRLFQERKDILEYYQNRFKYVMVDEYQDTNHAQYLLISLLASAHKNLCVVGDDDQSIYKFRGATIENILSFEEQFENATVIRLEQNYRSTQNILSAANKLISNNLGRKGKNLWTDAGEGEKIFMLRANDEVEESRIISDSILEHVKAGAKFSDHAILYRMNAQSNSVERALAKNAIPYRVVGGTRFFDHKEIRDVVAYLNLINNTSDELRMLRIVNEPKRGIGKATLDSAREIASTLGIDLFEVLENSEGYAPIAKKAAPLTAFTKLIRDFIDMSETKPLDYMFDQILTNTGYMKSLESQGFEGIGRIENVLEFKSIIVKYIQESEEPTLSGFLEEIALYTDLDNYDMSADNVTLMTIHSAKGLEFRYVYIAGMDDGIFPGRMAIASEVELEEERRLAYVAITRAKETLTMISAERRLIFGQTTYNRMSRFVSEIPEELMDLKTTTVPKKDIPPKKAVPKIPGTPSSRTIGVGSGGTSYAAPIIGDKINVGDRVAHKVFGEGKVLTAKPMASDTLLEIDFGGSVKKLMANFARLTKAD